MELKDVDAGTRFRLESVPAADLRARLLRLGFLDGPVTCRYRIRNGPVVINRKGTELAIGRPVAEAITVRPVGKGSGKGGGIRNRKRKRKRGEHTGKEPAGGERNGGR